MYHIFKLSKWSPARHWLMSKHGLFSFPDLSIRFCSLLIASADITVSDCCSLSNANTISLISSSNFFVRTWLNTALILSRTFCLAVLLRHAKFRMKSPETDQQLHSWIALVKCSIINCRSSTLKLKLERLLSSLCWTYSMYFTGEQTGYVGKSVKEIHVTVTNTW